MESFLRSKVNSYFASIPIILKPQLTHFSLADFSPQRQAAQTPPHLKATKLLLPGLCCPQPTPWRLHTTVSIRTGSTVLPATSACTTVSSLRNVPFSRENWAQSTVPPVQFLEVGLRTALRDLCIFWKPAVRPKRCSGPSQSQRGAGWGLPTPVDYPSSPIIFISTKQQLLPSYFSRTAFFPSPTTTPVGPIFNKATWGRAFPLGEKSSIITLWGKPQHWQNLTYNWEFTCLSCLYQMEKILRA